MNIKNAIQFVLSISLAVAASAIVAPATGCHKEAKDKYKEVGRDLKETGKDLGDAIQKDVKETKKDLNKETKK